MIITLSFWMSAFLLVPALVWKLVFWSAPKEARKVDKLVGVMIFTGWTWGCMAAARWLP